MVLVDLDMAFSSLTCFIFQGYFVCVTSFVSFPFDLLGMLSCIVVRLDS